ncbi:unnamed protein product [Ceutorhynchus assimilis]|uniref:MADF domain-containing protein n=1 Tax=Ceutorhynchus assimilis TaxID=467358 RepID=A0A9N9MV75_9CUCU|nr:unnamed protein product [Ceutorhynchus assimilis]
MGEIEFYDSEQLITEVEKRPSLYDKNIKEYNDKNVREKLWREVCEAIIMNWKEVNPECKEKTARDIQRKWKNIRDCFRKEINNEKKCKLGHGKRKRRKYIFYDRLLFLLPSMQEKVKKSNESDNSENEAEDNVETEETSAEQNTYRPPVWRPLTGRHRHPVYVTYEDSNAPSNIDNNDNDAMSEEIKVDRKEPIKQDEIDEDKYFLLSLVPSFKNLTADQKFSAKIEFLKILRNLSQSSSRSRRTRSPCSSEPSDSIAILKQEKADF